MGDRAFVGFAFFGPTLPHDLKRIDPDHNYSKEEHLSPLEIQAKTNLTKENYHKGIVALVGKQAIGVIICEWVKFSDSFWHYHIRYIDVHEKYKNQGVGTNLAKALNEAEFIKGRMFRLGMPTFEGEKYIDHVLKRELKAKDYVLLYEEYVGATPTKFGVYRE